MSSMRAYAEDRVLDIETNGDALSLHRMNIDVLEELLKCPLPAMLIPARVRQFLLTSSPAVRAVCNKQLQRVYELFCEMTVGAWRALQRRTLTNMFD
jgi:hypothetical protein